MRHSTLYLPLAAIAFTTLALVGAPSPAAPAGQLEASFRNTYNFKHFLKDDQIRVTSANGTATLTGTVSEEYHKFLAQETVAGLPGVKRVDNQLAVPTVPLAAHSDLLITMKVKTALLFHKFVNAGATEVHTQDGVVILSGTVDSEAMKRRTGEYAMDVDGVREVHNNMVVAPGYKTLGERVDDASISAQIKTTLLFRKSTHALATQVETSNGVVTLHGEAADQAEKDLVSTIALDTEGVLQVSNKMTLRQP